MNDDGIAAWLEREWAEALDGDAAPVDPEMDRLVDSKVASIRYAVYRITIGELVRGTFALLDEEWRVRFAKAIGAELDSVAEHRHRRDWSDLLTNL